MTDGGQAAGNMGNATPPVKSLLVESAMPVTGECAPIGAKSRHL